MTEILILFLAFVIWRSCKSVIEAVEQKAYEKRQFYLMVSQELDRMDKAQKECEVARNPTKWHLRN